MSARKSLVSPYVSLDNVLTRTALIKISLSSAALIARPSRLDAWADHDAEAVGGDWVGRSNNRHARHLR